MHSVRRTQEWRPSPRLDGLPGYGRGRAGHAAAFRHRLGSNEAPDPGPAEGRTHPLPAATLNRYPDLRGETLGAALARHHGVGADMVAVAAGSVILLDQLVRAACDAGDEIVTPWRSYEAYPIIAGVSGARLAEVPLDPQHGADPAALLAAVGVRCRVMLLCNPNNPTGTCLTDEAVDRLLAQVPRDRLVILDEAYVDYAREAGEVTSRPAALLARHANLAILRTFSKAWGLAGLRVGYCLAAPRVIAAVQAVAPPFPLPEPVAAVALATLGAPEAVAARVAQNTVERARMIEGLRSLGLPVAESLANFIWVPIAAQAEALTAHFAAASIAVRCFAGEGVRITTGTGVDTNAVLAAATSWCGN